MKKNYIFIGGMFAMLLSFFALTNTANAQLYINEFMASNDSAFPGPQGDYPDWIEIYNAGNEDVMLGGYYMCDTLNVAEAYMIPDTYPDSVTVAAGGFILFYANKEEASSVLNLNFKLSGSGEQIGLWNTQSAVVDTLTYGEQTGDVSYGRYPDGTENWGFMSDFTPGATNTNPSPPPVQLYINEFMASNDSSFPGPQGDYPDWIEIYNAGNEDVMLGGYYMCDTLNVAEAYMIPDTHPDSVTVPAGGFILFYANKEEASSVLNLNFKLSGSGEQIGLWSPDQEIIDTLTYTEQITDTSYGRFADGSDNWYFMSEITPGAPNNNPNPAVDVELYINEFMASNDSALAGPQGDYPDWIEIYNAGNEDVMLGGYYMYDALDVAEAYMIPDIHPDSVTVPAGGFILFYANKEEASSVLNLNFKLSGSGEQIGLWSPDQEIIDTLTYTEQITDTSYGRFPDGSNDWFMMPDYTPGAANQNISSINNIGYNISALQNFPNPFSTETNIRFTLVEPEQVLIQLFDVRGTLIKEVINAKFLGGTHNIILNASDLPAGQYFYSLQTTSSMLTRKALIVR